MNNGWLTMRLNSLFNYLWMQLIWFAAVLGAANKIVWPVLVLFMVFVVSVLHSDNRVKGDFQLMLVAVVVGFILDTTWVKVGWLEFTSSSGASHLAPWWIILLWASLALTINHSLVCLQQKLWLAATVFAFASPLSYAAAAKLGAVTIVATDWLWFCVVGASWAIAVPLLLWLGHYLRQLNSAESQHD
ncbi:DUF2878 domain-containing protein [Methyloglobulus sp.]|uniref:DUF2878 domain-containing protein n=1 Tax=Methyloglobulus sp. TaxID=2518622 RepID=UPI0032B7B97F